MDTFLTSVEQRSIEQAARDARPGLLSHIERYEQQLKELESGMVGMLGDHDTIQEDQDSTRRLVAAIRADLNRSRQALQRIDDGRYGRCTACGAPIAPARLEAIPAAERCAACA